jgi:hypothetical protein
MIGMSAVGTFRTWQDVRLESVMRSKAEVEIISKQPGASVIPEQLCGWSRTRHSDCPWPIGALVAGDLPRALLGRFRHSNNK